MPHSPTTALVLETNNLRGGGAPGDAGAPDRIVASLARLLGHLRAQTRPLSSLDGLVVTHDGLSPEHRARLEAAADRPIHFVELPPGAGYYDAKNRGFDATTAELVVFGDADCWPDPAWLERLLAPLSDGAAAVVAGRTTYRDGVIGAAATSIDFMYFPSPLGEGNTRNFYANNVAFRRAVFAAHRYRPADAIYRGHCQMLGLRLAAAGVPVRFAPEAHTVHRFPDGLGELVRLRLLRGADTTEMTPHFADALLPARLRWLGRLGPVSPLGVLAARLGFSARALGRQGGRPLRAPERAAALAAMGCLSAVDALGAVGRAAGRLDLGVRDGALGHAALSYHGNADGLS